MVLVVLPFMSSMYLDGMTGLPTYQMNFTQYLNTQVPIQHQTKFHRFYNHQLDKQLERKEERRSVFKRNRAKVRSAGMARIEKAHPAIFRDVADKITRPETPKSTKQSIERYVLREGYLAQYLARIQRESKTVWGLARNYAGQAWDTMRTGVLDTYSSLTKESDKKTDKASGKKLQSQRRARTKGIVA